MKTLFRIGIILLAMLLSKPAFSEIRLPAVIQSGMVLQQNENVKLWGWADPGEKVTIKLSWQKKKIKTRANEKGNGNRLFEPSKPEVPTASG